MDLPDDCVPIDAEVIEDGYRISEYGDLAAPFSKPPIHSLTFHEYLDRQQDHERCALLRFDTYGRDIHDVVLDMSNLDDILLVSDGGAAYKCGSYGWVLGTKTGRRIARGSGTVFGYDPKSYRAEISGSRAGLLFISHAMVYCNAGAFPTGCLSVYCDNSGFVTKIATLREYSLALTAHCLDAEWDLLASVIELLANFPTPPSFEHIQGHQDRHRDYDSLDVISQMNVDADALASSELAEYGMIHPIVPFDPTSLVLLHIGGRTVTHNIEAAVRDQLFLGPLRSYYCARFRWSAEIYDSIDWDAYAMAYSHHSRSRKFFHQFGWKKLPCGGRIHARESRFDDRCPSCLQPDESDDHLFQCLHSDRRQWRKAFITGIVDHLTPFFDPNLLDMIRLGLQGYFSNNLSAIRSRFPVPTLHPQIPIADGSSLSSHSSKSYASSVSTPVQCSPCSPMAPSPSTSSEFEFLPESDQSDSDYDPDDSQFTAKFIRPHIPTYDRITALRLSQDAIGWDHFLRGKISSEWSRLQFKFAATHNFIEQSKNWQQWLIKYMATQSFNLWCSRNRCRHGDNHISNRQSQLTQARRDVSALYELQDRVLPQDRDLFCASLEIHLLQPLAQLRQWLTINKDLIHLSIRTAVAQAKSKTQPIRKFLTTLGRRSSTVTSKSRSAKPRPFLVPSRVTRFFPINPTKSRSKSHPPPSASSTSSLPQPLFSRPRQRYLYDFFPNHPG